MLTLVKEFPQWGNTALLFDATEEVIEEEKAARPLSNRLADLTEVQRYVLARIAVHTWTHDGSIPFYASNVHQRKAAISLTHPDVGLAEAIVSHSYRLFFRLTDLGGLAADRLFNIMPSTIIERQEVTFNQMRQLMRNLWETGDDVVEAAHTPPAPKCKRRLRLVK